MSSPPGPTTLDTNVAIYAFDDASAKAPIARAIVSRAAFVSVQVLNEFASVTVRKRKRPISDATWAIGRIRNAIPDIHVIRAEDNAEALRIAERYKLSFYDSLMLAVALAGGARTIFSEDMQHGLEIDGVLTIADPFR